jgi:hypothetical protein
VVNCEYFIEIYHLKTADNVPRSKYPLALISKVQDVFPAQKKLVGYDIGCSFAATAQRGIPGLNARFVVPAMHGYAHNRACQLGHHPKYVAGAGLEDFETCERFFSISNACAPTTRYTTSFHRHQLLHTHFHDYDEDRCLAEGRLIYSGYKDASARILALNDTFSTLNLQQEVLTGVYAKYLDEENSYLTGLKTEPTEEQSRFHYVTSLEKSWAASENWEQAAAQIGMTPGLSVSPTAPLPPHLTKMLTAYNVAMAELCHFERILGIVQRWEPSSSEYKEAKKDAGERTYNLALRRLERLVVQRLFELQKANLVSTGESFFVFQVI